MCLCCIFPPLPYHILILAVLNQQRFLNGDNKYRNGRCKVIPYVVDGPLAIRLIKPKPLEVSVDGPRHPSTWENVPQSFNPTTGKTNHAIVEVDIDVLSEKTIRKGEH